MLLVSISGAIFSPEEVVTLQYGANDAFISMALCIMALFTHFRKFYGYLSQFLSCNMFLSSACLSF